MEVSRAFVKNPGEINSSEPASFLYQAGYLSVRAVKDENIFTLDYPNREVYESMSRLLVNNFIGGAAIADGARVNLLKALENGDVDALILVFNEFLAKIPYDIYSKANRKTPVINNIKINFHEWLCHANLLSFLIGSGLDARAESHTNHGQSDLVVFHSGRVWVIELKMARKDNDAAVAKEALKQIKEKGYADPYDNSILLGIAIDESKRAIGAWEVEYKSRP
ncbi:MAG: PD-(D/E)XK nuclease domain-containing protein [Deltaproteobacteria bacterium]|nr:PD-(D/E)XK nuclease domain-containing protein [Deltaproteobacteria bacterium]